jgi:hypothetical protein
MTDAKHDLHVYLREGRAALLWKLDGLSEYDARRPLTPTGTNLLGLVKHMSTVQLLTLGWVFDRHFTEPVAWFRRDLPPNTDMWALPEESRAYVVGVFERASAHADATIAELDPDTRGNMPWLADADGRPTLIRAMAHVVAELHRHLGQADIVRELADGTVGLYQHTPFLPDGDAAWWADHRDRVERAAKEAAG